MDISDHDPTLRLSLLQADNGWILRTPDGLTVIEDGEGESAQAEAVQRLLYAILDILGLAGSKHDAYRVRVEIEQRQA
jgi:hypothetical protein